MAENIGELAVALTGRLDQLQEVLNQARDEVNKFGDKQEEANKKSSDSWGKLAFAALGAYASIKAAALGAVAATENWAKSIDELRDVTGMEERQASLVVAQLKHFGIESGIAAFAAFQLSSRAEMGSASFSKLGINVKDANGHIKSGGQLFTEVVDALRNETNETTRNALAKELLGRSSIRLTDFLKANKDEIDKVNESVKKSGLIFSKDAVDAYEKYSFALNDLKAAVVGVLRTFSDAFLPTLAKNVASIKEGLQSLRSWIEEHRSLVVSITETVSGLALFLAGIVAAYKMVELFRKAIVGLEVAYQALKVTTVALSGVFSVLTLKIAAALAVGLAYYELLAHINQAAGGSLPTLEQLVSRTSAWVKGLMEEKTAHEEVASAIKKHSDSRRELNDQEKKILIETAKLREEDVRAFRLEQEEKRKELEKTGIRKELIDQFMAANEKKFFKDLIKTQKEERDKNYNEFVDERKKEVGYDYLTTQQKIAFVQQLTLASAKGAEDRVYYAKWARDLEIQADKERRDKLLGSLTSIRDKFSDTFSEAILGTKNINEAFTELGKYLLDDFVKTIMRMVIQKLIETTLLAIGLKSVLGGPGATASPIGTVFSGLFGAADGGIFTKPTPALIGEGDEPEAVIPLSKLKDMVGGTNRGNTVVIENFNFENKPINSFGTPAETRRAAMNIRMALQRVGT